MKQCWAGGFFVLALLALPASSAVAQGQQSSRDNRTGSELKQNYPNPFNTNLGYVVINSGHTFKEADLKGTNALLYPRLGDWAVIKPTPTDTDPAAYEVVAAGLFDENWQFPKKK